MLPVVAVRGRRDGPYLLATGAVHGDEYEGPVAIQRLAATLDPDGFAGLFVGVPVVNTAAYAARSRTTPADGLDLNRVFPGASGGGPSHALAAVLFDTFVAACDALIDMHSGGVRLVHLPLIGWYSGDDGAAERIARGFGPAFHPWILGDVPGVLSREAARAGKLALGAEWGGGARLDPAGVDGYVAGMRHVLAALDPDTPTSGALDLRAPIAGGYQAAERSGLFVPVVALGEPVTEGRLLGVLYDPLGELQAEIRAQRSGLVAGLAHLALVQAGERVVYIG
jgi:predicted deacylase